MNRPWKGWHLKSLGRSKPRLLKELSQSGKLTDHLQEVGTEAQETFESIVASLKESHPSWTQDQIEKCAEEMVLQDLVLVKDEASELADRVGYLD